MNNLNHQAAGQFQDAVNQINVNNNLTHTALLGPATVLANPHLTNNPVISPFLNSFHSNYASYPSATAQTAYSQNEFDFTNPTHQTVNHHLTNPNLVPTLSHHQLINPTAAFLAGPLMTASLTNNGLLAPVSSIAAATSGKKKFNLNF